MPVSILNIVKFQLLKQKALRVYLSLQMMVMAGLREWLSFRLALMLGSLG